jgi:hypothetical protein
MQSSLKAVLNKFKVGNYIYNGVRVGNHFKLIY